MEPKQIKSSSGLRISPRPERYEWEEISNSPPPSTQNILQLFDTSSLARDHPHKYQLLLAQDEGEQGLAAQASERPRNSSTQIHINPLQSFRKNKSLVDLKTFFQEQSLKHEDEKVELREALSEGDLTMARSSPQTNEQNLESTNLSEIAQKYVGFSHQTEPQDQSFSLDEAIVLDDHVSVSSNVSSMPSTSAVKKTDAVCDSNDLVPVSIQPKPRRFLGIGGYFNPLPETVLLPKDAAKSHKLADEIQKRGITAATQDLQNVSIDATDCKRKAPTKAEMNIWAPSGL